jgi:hypothetical protein
MTEKTKTCATCLHLSRRDACCELTGDTRRGGDPACPEHTDGSTERRNPDPVCADCGRDLTADGYCGCVDDGSEE